MANNRSRILIIEDEKPLREVYAMILEKEGYEVSTANNGRAGINKLQSFKPNLIILDLLMPVMDGIQFLKSANLPLKHPGVKVIIVSNLSTTISKSDTKKYGVLHCFLKVDLSPSDLANVVRKYTTV